MQIYFFHLHAFRISKGCKYGRITGCSKTCRRILSSTSLQKDAHSTGTVEPERLLIDYNNEQVHLLRSYYDKNGVMSKSLYGAYSAAKTDLIPEPFLVFNEQKKYELIAPPNYPDDKYEKKYFISQNYQQQQNGLIYFKKDNVT